MPYSIAFMTNPSIIFKILDAVINVIFFTDIILMLYTTYQDHKGHEIKDHNQIVSHYLTSIRFWFDFLSFLGVLENIKYQFQYLKLFKITRITRIQYFISHKVHLPDEKK